ncbi:MAG: rhomboid family intramembrane serine protease [Candidatus Xenobia bacterium]
MPLRLVLYAILPVFVLTLPVMLRYPRWYAGAIVQMLLLLGVTVAGLTGWMPEGTAALLAYGGLVLFRMLPEQLRRPTTNHATLRVISMVMPLLEWGSPGLSASEYARAVGQIASGDRYAAARFADRWGNRTDAGPAGQIIKVFALDLLRLAHMHERVQAVVDAAPPDPGAPYLSALLRAARSDAEVGDWEQVFARWDAILAHPMVMILQSPIGRQAVLELHALAGDGVRLEQDLQRYGSDFAAFAWMPASWRARCAERRGESAAAREGYREALRMARPGDTVRTLLQERLDAVDEVAESRPDAARYEALCSRIDGMLLRTEAVRGFVLVPPQPVTALLIFACAVMWAASEWMGGSQNVGTLYRLGAMTGGGPWWRYFTALFLHAGVLHLAFNMFGLAYFGSQVEVLFGRVRYLLLYLVTGVLANAAGAMDSQICVGASGAVLAVLGAYTAAFLMGREQVPPIMRRNALGLLGFLLVAQFSLDHTSTVINQMAHMAGAALGLAFGVLLRPRLSARAISRSPRAAGRGWRVAIMVAVAVGAYASLHNWKAEQARQRAEAALKAGQPQVARQEIERSLDLNAIDPISWFVLADVDSADGNTDAFRRDMVHGLDLSPPIEPFNSLRRRWLR